MGKKLLFLMATCVLLAPAAAVRVGVSTDELRLLRQMFRSRFAAYSQQPDSDQAVWDINYAVAKFEGPGEPAERYKTMVKGLAIMAYGGWDEGREVSTLVDVRLPSKLYQPGDTIKVSISPLYERKEPLEGAYSIRLELVDADGKRVGEQSTIVYRELAAKEVPLKIPAGLAPGPYSVAYTIEPDQDHEDGPLLTARRNVFVVRDLRKRLASLAKNKAKLLKSKSFRKSPRHKLALNTVEWLLSIYQQSAKETFSGPPIFIDGAEPLAAGRFAHRLRKGAGPGGRASRWVAGR